MKCKKCGNGVLRSDYRYMSDPYLSCPICGWIHLKGLQIEKPMSKQEWKASAITLSTDPEAIRCREKARAKKIFLKDRLKNVQVVKVG